MRSFPLCKYRNDAATGIRTLGLGLLLFGSLTGAGGLIVLAGGAMATGASIGDKLSRLWHRCKGRDDGSSSPPSREWAFDAIERGATGYAKYRASQDPGKILSLFVAKSAIGFVCPPCETAIDVGDTIIDLS
jgi:hypothetical protein